MIRGSRLGRLSLGFRGDSPIGLDLELLKQSLEIPVEWSPERPSFRVSSGPNSAALGPAL